MPENRQPSGAGWLRTDPDRLDRFAGELEELIVLLERILAKEDAASLFLSPSRDPASARTTEHLAGDAHDLPNTPARAISMAIGDLTQQALAARMAARDYRAIEQESAERIRRAGEPPA